MLDINERTIKQALKDAHPELESTHTRLSIPIIKRMYIKMKNDIDFDEIKVCDNLIMDGHHRYVSSMLVGKSLGRVKSSKTSATRTTAWADVDYVEEEWDTPEKIYRLNVEDAEFNKISLERLIEITNLS